MKQVNVPLCGAPYHSGVYSIGCMRAEGHEEPHWVLTSGPFGVQVIAWVVEE